MKGFIIHYLLKNSETKEKSRIQRFLYGYKDHSNRGSYSYQRKGFLSDKLYKKIDQRVILIQEKEKKKVISILEENHAKVEIIPVEIKKKFFK